MRAYNSTKKGEKQQNKHKKYKPHIIQEKVPKATAKRKLKKVLPLHQVFGNLFLSSSLPHQFGFCLQMVPGNQFMESEDMIFSNIV